MARSRSTRRSRGDTPVASTDGFERQSLGAYRPNERGDASPQYLKPKALEPETYLSLCSKRRMERLSRSSVSPRKKGRWAIVFSHAGWTA